MKVCMYLRKSRQDEELEKRENNYYIKNFNRNIEEKNQEIIEKE